jgi:hypothetical protein
MLSVFNFLKSRLPGNSPSSKTVPLVDTKSIQLVVEEDVDNSLGSGYEANEPASLSSASTIVINTADRLTDLSSSTNSEVGQPNESSLPEFFGKGRFNRPGWKPKSLNGIRKIKYQGLIDYHFIKVWYSGLPEFTFDIWDYETLVEKHPTILPICIQAIRNGVLSKSRVATLVTSGSKKRGIENHTVTSSASSVKIPFQSGNTHCVVNALANVMDFHTELRDSILRRLPDDETNLKNLSRFLNGKGLDLKRITIGRADKKEWLLSSAEPGKYLVSGNGHVVGVIVSSIANGEILDSCFTNRTLLGRRTLNESLGNDVDEIRLIYDIRNKRSKAANKLDNM